MEEIKVRSDEDYDGESGGAGSGGGGSVGGVVAVVPKKRGRPAKPDSVKKPKTGRGRGRPPASGKKDAVLGNNADSGSDGGGGVANGNENKVAKRGRPAKGGKKKIVIEATGRGRGRPKSENGSKSEKKRENIAKSGKSPKKSGRPRKEVSESDDDHDASDDSKDDDEEARPVGRPPTGAVNLNIERTGRGQGRPKKDEGGAAKKRAAVDGEESGAKKRGRPALGNKPAKVSSGKSRGRPKKEAAANTDDENIDDDEEEEENEASEVETLNTKGQESNGDDCEKVNDEENDDDF